MIKRVFVVGAGAMGSGIAQVTAQSGFDVTVMDINQAILKKGLAGIDKGVSRSVQKGSISEQDKANIMSRIHLTTELSSAKEADLVIEAVPEILELKLETFGKLDKACPEQCILASNTSALPISAIAAATSTERQPQVIGIHFMNPVPVMRGVELIRGRHTSTDTFQISKSFVESLGKEPAEAMDYPGFILSRIIDAMMNEAFYCVMDGANPEDLDKIMRNCANFPMGPLELCDLVGADIVLHGLETMHKDFGDRLLPAPILKSMVRSGDLGRKTGKGFYDYNKD